MAALFTLVENTPYRLRYLVTSQGGSPTISFGILVNRNGPTPDLRGDSNTFLGSPMNKLVSTPTVNQAAARKLLFGDSLLSVADNETPRACVRLTATTTALTKSQWAVDANEGAAAGDPASAGFPVLVVYAPSIVFEQAYLDIYFEHTYDR